MSGVCWVFCFVKVTEFEKFECTCIELPNFSKFSHNHPPKISIKYLVNCCKATTIHNDIIWLWGKEEEHYKWTRMFVIWVFIFKSFTFIYSVFYIKYICRSLFRLIFFLFFQHINLYTSYTFPYSKPLLLKFFLVHVVFRYL